MFLFYHNVYAKVNRLFFVSLGNPVGAVSNRAYGKFVLLNLTRLPMLW